MGEKTDKIKQKLSIEAKHSMKTGLILLIIVLIIYGAFILIYKNYKLGLVAVVPIATTLILTLGLMPLLKVELNVFSVMISSIIVGIGIDHNIHFIQRFLEEKKYKPLGQPQYISSDVRIIVAAQKNLWELVERKQFRRDLFYRLNVVNIYLPPLRNRKSDIPVLITHFVKKYSELYNKNINGITPKARMN